MANNFDLDEFNRHMLYLERLASGGINSVVLPSLAETYEAVAAILGGYDSINNQAQLNAISAAIRQAVESNSGWATLTQEDLQPLLEYEAQWQAEYMSAQIGDELQTPVVAVLNSAVNEALLDLSSGARTDVGLWSEFIEANTEARFQQYDNIAKRGFIRGESISEMQRQMRTVTEGLLRREAETLARTGYAHYASVANETMVQQNSDILDEYYYVITFDNRLSSICRQIGVSYNNPKNRLKVGDPKAPKPPLHMNCRTRRLAVPKGYMPDGTRAAVGGKKGEKAAEAFENREKRLRTKSKVTYRGKRDSDIFKAGQIDASEGYEAWLRRQPRFFVEDSLGVGKAKLFLDEGLSLTKFSDMTARPLTLAEIMEREGIEML